MNRRLTRQTALQISKGLKALESQLQRDDSRRFARDMIERLELLLAGNDDTFDTDWPASDWGDLAYLLSTRVELGCRELAARMCTGRRKLGWNAEFNCDLKGD